MATALVVDDDRQMQRLLTGLLKAQGFTCEVAGDVAEARSRLLTFTPSSSCSTSSCRANPA